MSFSDKEALIIGGGSGIGLEAAKLLVLLKPGTDADGLRLTRQVWSDMRSFDGYISHQILIDQDAPAHIIALAKWRSRADADAVREKYQGSETIRKLTPVLARPRDRWVTCED